MARGDPTLTCNSCGASLRLPADPAALEISCEYCGNHQLLSKQVIEQRDKANRKRAAKQARATPAVHVDADADTGTGLGVVLTMMTIGGVAMVGLILTIVFFVRIEVEGDPAMQAIDQQANTRVQDHVDDQVAANQPPEPPPLPEETEDNNGLSLVRARMDALHQAGCDRVLTPPTRFEQGVGFTGEFTPGHSCVIVLAATAMPDTTVALEAKDPHGNLLETPAAASAFEWRFCPTLAGQHAMTVIYDGRGPYHMASYDCPKRKFKALAPVAAPFAPVAAEAPAPALAGE